MMKSKKWQVVLLFTVVLVMLLGSTVGLLADTGNHNDYSSGSDYEYSISGSDSDIGFVFDLVFILLRLPFPLNIIVVGFLVVLFMKYKPQRDVAKRTVTSDRGTVSIKDHTSEIEKAIRKHDPHFSTGKFLGWSEEVFMTIQQAWTERDWDKIRPFEKEELYRKHQLQLQEYINNGTINVVERVNINQTFLYRYDRDNEYEYLTVYLQSRMNDYIIDAGTRQVVRGDKNREYHTKYFLTFMRKNGVKTNAAEGGMIEHHCPNCGAPLEVTSSGKCEYCDTIITTGEHDWVLSDLDSIKTDTKVKQGGVFIK